MRTKKPTSFRLSPEALDLLTKLCEKLGLSQTAVIEYIVRRVAEQEGIDRDTNTDHTVSTE